ncbi:ABC transporter permease [Roseovarius nubinhibens]|uniref:ABC transporter, permease protein n=1 Tax=Roseovarius nubinhibens (strain ATCC BAA-591 / DSM 15170 / ISM) TaxID=89187 RepID=A3SK85_ROSNI|nr:FtsX-like permease family protein [Roseovarius nubinhibens]EAP77766.1 ABC transporter, permease protein [Roseovarius nubinhibens ISM]
MSLRSATRLALRELRGGLGPFWVLLACLILGAAAIAAVGSTRAAIQAGLTSEGARLLGGDAEVELTYRAPDATERAWLEARADRLSQVTEFRSMAVTPDGSRALTQVKAVDDLYPLVGRVRLNPDMPLSDALDGAEGLPGAVLDPALMARLGIVAGDRITLGEQAFHVSAALEFEPDSITGGFELGPRSLLREADLASSGLLAPGTLFTTRTRLDLPPGADPDALLSELGRAFPDRGLSWRDARNGAPGVAEFVDRLGAFLILVGLSGLAVGGVGIATAVQAYLAGKVTVIATLRTLGASRRVIFLTYFIQIGILTALGLAIGVTLGALVPWLLGPYLGTRLPVPAEFGLYGAPLAEAAIYGLLAALIFTLWPLARAADVRAATLFRPSERRDWALPGWPYLATIAGATALLVLLAALFSGNWRLTVWTAGGIAGALLLLTLAGLAIERLAARARPLARRRPALLWALGAIGGPGRSALPVVLSLGLGLSVLAAVGQIDGNLRSAIRQDLPDKAPAFFFVDIQKDQMPAFRQRLDSDPAVDRIDSAPMLRGIITRINGQPAREVAGDHWVLNGDRGISYADALPDRTRLTQGTWWPEEYSGTPQLSFAAEEAAEMGLALGDEITVNILGRDITATLTSLREVDFSTAGMGFIMVMNPAALEAAPHSFIATVYATPEAEPAILRDISEAMPNVTAIRVRDAIDRVSGLLAGLAAATAWGAAATLVTGFLVLIGAAAADQRNRIFEAAVLRTLGAGRARILASHALRAALLGAAAGAVAILAGILGGWAVSHFVMHTGFAVIWPSALIIVAAGVGVTLLAGLGFAWAPLKARPARVLRAQE